MSTQPSPGIWWDTDLSVPARRELGAAVKPPQLTTLDLMDAEIAHLEGRGFKTTIAPLKALLAQLRAELAAR